MTSSYKEINVGKIVHIANHGSIILSDDERKFLNTVIPILKKGFTEQERKEISEIIYLQFKKHILSYKPHPPGMASAPNGAIIFRSKLEYKYVEYMMSLLTCVEVYDKSKPDYQELLDEYKDMLFCAFYDYFIV